MNLNTRSPKITSYGHAPVPNLKERDHLVQFYRDEKVLFEALADYLNGIDDQGQIIVIATDGHRSAIAAMLREPLIANGNVRMLDAEEVLASFMVEDMPDEALFDRHVGELVRQQRAGASELRAFGEMVNLLWRRGLVPAAIRLEELWNKLLQTQSFSLYCAYDMRGLDDAESRRLIEESCRLHDHDFYFDDHKQGRTANVKSEASFKHLVEAVTEYAIYMLDPHGFVSTWNAGAQRIKGYSASEIIGQHFSKFFTEPERRSGKPLNSLKQALQTGRYSEEGQRVRKDGSRFWARIVLTPVYGGRRELIGFAKITQDMTERKKSETHLAAKNEKLERFNALMINRELEMIKLKRELNAALIKCGLPPKYPLL